MLPELAKVHYFQANDSHVTAERQINAPVLNNL